MNDNVFHLSASQSARALTVGFSGYNHLPVKTPDQIEAINAAKGDKWVECVVRERGLFTALYIDPIGRRLNVYGGFIDCIEVTLTGFVDCRAQKLLRRCGYETLCDLSRDTKDWVADIPGIESEIDQVELALKERGLRFSSAAEAEPESQFVYEDYKDRLMKRLREERARRLRDSITLIQE